ncbi:hypothetical protein [Streptomyces sp. NPDC058045]|uniref:hypothetical protein n=1 Tax=Streptomyces sp. NPDC058045 TaxID=3346311 RepID=UPI0036EEFA43
MARQPTAAQRRLIAAAAPDTGRVRGTPAQLAALVRLGLAFRHPRPPHDHFLTPAGHRLREQPAQPPSPPATPPPGQPAAVQAPFTARTGTEDGPDGDGDGADGGAERARQVRSAWQGLLELRRMTRPDGATELPCGWERTHLVQAAALALEAAGCPPRLPSRPGYRVTATPQPEAVAVDAPGPGELRRCAAALEAAGWQTGEHTEPRTARRYLLASPRRA